MKLNDKEPIALTRASSTKHPRHLRPLGILACASALLTTSGATFAAITDVTDSVSDEARTHFDHALALLDQGQPGQAMIEFQAAYRIKPSPTVLYNIGLTYVALQQPVEAIEALSQYLSQVGTGAHKARREAVEAEIARQQSRIAAIQLSIVPSGASVNLDGKELGRAPINGTIKVASGTRRIEVKATGYQTATHELAANGLQTINLVVALAPKAPLVSAEASATGQLKIQVLPSSAKLWIDGAPSPSQVTLPAGRHVVTVNEFGYAPQNQAVQVLPNGQSVLKLVLAPSAELENERHQRTQVQRNWAYGLGASGLALAGAALGVFLWNDARSRNWHSTQTRLDTSWSQPPYPSDLPQRQSTNDELSSSIHQADEATVGLAVSGGLLLTSSVVLLVTGQDRSEPMPVTVASDSRGGTLRYSSSW